jgi:hypothetical protein
MTAEAIIRELQSRGIRLALNAAGKVEMRGPRGRITPELVRVVSERKHELLGAMAEKERQTSDRLEAASEAQTLIDTTLGRVAVIREHASPTWLRINALMKEFEPMISSLFEAGDYESLKYCLLDLERNVKDATTWRGYDNELN